MYPSLYGKFLILSIWCINLNKINSNIKLIEELENHIKSDLEIFIDTIKANNHHVKIEIYTRRASI